MSVFATIAELSDTILSDAIFPAIAKHGGKNLRRNLCQAAR
jgi:hypothetical protein